MAFNKNKSKKILKIIIAIELILASFNIFLVIPKKPKKINNIPEVSNTAQQTPSKEELERLKKLEEFKEQIKTIDKQVKIDVVNQNIPVELNGNYSYNSIIELAYEDSAFSTDKELICTEINGKNLQELEQYLHKHKLSHSKEYISFNCGHYHKQNNKIKTEDGFYYGNANKSYLYVKNPNGKIELNGNYYSISNTVSQTGYWLTAEHKTDGTKLYVREKLLCDGKIVFVTYEYNLINY